MSHTPGPWKYRQFPEYADVRADNYGTVCALPGAHDWPERMHADHQAQSEANGRLIEAAPAMLEALQGVVRGAQYNAGTKAWLKSIETAKAAIAQAKGDA